MNVSAKDVVELLKKMDEAEAKAGLAFGSSSEEDLQAAVEKMRELRQMLYSMLAREDAALAVPYPVVIPYRDAPWWETTRVTCKSEAEAR